MCDFNNGVLSANVVLQENEVCHAYLTRLFPGVARLIHGREDKIVALVSPQQETLTLAKV